MIDWIDLSGWIPPEWLAAITSSAVVSVLGIALGTYYKAKVEKAVQHNFDAKLEKVRADFRQDEERLKADLRANGEQIAALRAGALSGLASRNAAIDKRRLEAIERLWAAVVHQAQYKMAIRMTAALHMDKAIELAAKGDAEAAKIQGMANLIWETSGLDKVTVGPSSDTERPFLPPLAWALFSAYRQVVAHPLAQLAAIRSGVGPKMLVDPKPMLELVKSALPHKAEFIDNHGTGVLSYLVGDLEEKLLLELQKSLSNPGADQAGIEQAAAILRAADAVAEAARSGAAVTNP